MGFKNEDISLNDYKCNLKKQEQKVYESDLFRDVEEVFALPTLALQQQHQLQVLV